METTIIEEPVSTVMETPVAPKAKRAPVFSILSSVIAGISMIPMLGIASLVSLVLSIIGLVREKHVTAIIGLVLSIVSLILSTTVWMLLGATWLSVYCSVADCSTAISTGVQKTLENPQARQAITAIMKPMPSANGHATLPAEWVGKEFDQTPEAMNKSIFAKSSFFMNSYETSPNYTAIFLKGIESKDAGDTLDAYIAKQNQKLFAAKYPALKVTPMPDVEIHNQGNPALNKAQLRMFSDSTLGTQEVVAYVDGGSHVYVVILSAANYDELMKAWPVFSDVVINHIQFSVSSGSPASTVEPAKVPEKPTI